MQAEEECSALREKLVSASRRTSVLEEALTQKSPPAAAAAGGREAPVPPGELQRLQTRCRSLQARCDENDARIAELESLLLNRPDSRAMSMSAAPSPWAGSSTTSSAVPTPTALSPSASPMLYQ